MLLKVEFAVLCKNRLTHIDEPDNELGETEGEKYEFGFGFAPELARIRKVDKMRLSHETYRLHISATFSG
jgi:hypothetical protein